MTIRSCPTTSSFPSDQLVSTETNEFYNFFSELPAQKRLVSVLVWLNRCVHRLRGNLQNVQLGVSFAFVDFSIQFGERVYSSDLKNELRKNDK